MYQTANDLQNGLKWKSKLKLFEISWWNIDENLLLCFAIVVFFFVFVLCGMKNEESMLNENCVIFQKIKKKKNILISIDLLFNSNILDDLCHLLQMVIWIPVKQLNWREVFYVSPFETKNKFANCCRWDGEILMPAWDVLRPLSDDV